MKKLLLTLSIVAMCSTSYAQFWEDNIDWKESQMWEQAKAHQTPEWFLDAKFGIYFHWGVYSYMGMTEWYSRQMYDTPPNWGKEVRPHHLATYGADVHYHHFFPKFTAEHFDAKDWAKLFKASGAKFAGPVAEHCDNFSNWDSKVNRYNTVNYGPKRDLVGELEEAIKGEKLKFVTTFHHSWEWGWYNLWSGWIDNSDPEFTEFYGEYTPKETFMSFSSKGKHAASGQFFGEVKPEYAPSRKFVDTWKAKIYEVIDNYKPDLLWFDSRLFILPEKDRAEMVNYYYDQAKRGKQEVVLTYKNLDLPFGTAVIDLEKGRMNDKTDYPWLTDDSFAWNAWGWSHKMVMKSANDVVDELVDITSKNGCLILNITPTYDGLIPEEQREGLLKVGEWLSINGEGIYGTRPFVVYGEGTTELKSNTFGGVQARGVKFTDGDFRFTTNGKNLYIIQLAAPKAGESYTLKTFASNGDAAQGKINKVTMLGSKEKIEWSHSGDGLTITAPSTVPSDYAVVYKVHYTTK
ncbi:MAG: alpha-L-fucosidase [Rikenellaceae bacterium]